MSYASSIDINARLYATLSLFQQYGPVRRSKFSAKARKLLRSTGGWVNGQEVLDASTGLAYNPSSGRVVPRARLYRNDQAPRAKLVNDTRTFIERQIDRVIDTTDEVTFDYRQMQMLPGGARYVLEKFPAGIKVMIATKEASLHQAQYDKIYAYNMATRNNLIERMGESVEVVEGASGQGSDTKTCTSIIERGFFTVTRLRDAGQIEGSFFPYTINHPLPLDRYGIHSELRADAYKEREPRLCQG